AESNVQLSVAGDAGAERSSAAGDSVHGGRSAYPVVATIRQHVRERWPAVDTSGEAVAGAVAADAVLDSQRTTADGGDRLQPAVSLVCGIEHGRRGVGRDHVHQEPRPVAGGRGGEGVPGASGGAGTDPRPDFGRALHGGWDVVGSMGGGEEFSAERRKDTASAGRSWQPDRELSRGEAFQSDPRIEDRSRCQTGTQKRGQGGQVEL